MKVQSKEESVFLKALNKESSRPPVWLMRQAGRYQKEYRKIREKVSFLELCKTPELASEVTVFAVRQLDVDAAIIFADILLILDSLGLELRFAENHGPVFDKPIKSKSCVEQMPEIDVRQSLGYVGESIKMTVDELSTIPVIGFAGAPFTVASYAIEAGSSKTFSKTKKFMYQETDSWHLLMNKLVEYTYQYLVMQIEAGASCVQLFDSWVGCLTPHDYKKYVFPHMKSLFEKLKQDTPTIYFGTTTSNLLPQMKDLSCSVIGVDWRNNLDEAWKTIGYDKGIQGNLDPIVLLADKGTIKENAERILKQSENRPGFIFNLGHGIVPQTPVDNAKYLVNVVKEYYQED